MGALMKERSKDYLIFTGVIKYNAEYEQTAHLRGSFQGMGLLQRAAVYSNFAVAELHPELLTLRAFYYSLCCSRLFPSTCTALACPWFLCPRSQFGRHTGAMLC